MNEITVFKDTLFNSFMNQTFTENLLLRINLQIINLLYTRD